MIARQKQPGVIVLIDEEEAWREIFFGPKPTVEESGAVIEVPPGSKALSLVADLSWKPDSSPDEDHEC